MNLKHKKIILSILFITSLLSACGGDGSVTVAEGGISGTGITAGRITAFGSIYVNGVKFNVDTATFLRDGVKATGQEEFSIGEYVVINGSINANDTTGIAQKVVFKDLLEGVVTRNSSDNLTIEVLGQRIEIDNRTQLIDGRKDIVTFAFNNLIDLQIGNIVEVSGIKNAAGLIKATSIKLKEERFVSGDSENEIKGNISSLNTSDYTFMLGATLVDYRGATFSHFNAKTLANGQYIEVKSRTNIIGNKLIADKIELKKDEKIEVKTGVEVEIEGLVTRFVSTQDFDVNGITVTTNSATEYKDGKVGDIHLNIEVEIKGVINDEKVLVAKEIEFDD